MVEQPPSLHWRRPSATIREVNTDTSPSPRKPESNSRAQLREILNKTNATDTNKVDKKTNTFLTSESKRYNYTSIPLGAQISSLQFSVVDWRWDLNEGRILAWNLLRFDNTNSWEISRAFTLTLSLSTKVNQKLSFQNICDICIYFFFILE